MLRAITFVALLVFNYNRFSKSDCNWQLIY